MLELPRLLLVMAARTHHLLARHLVDWDWNRVATLSISIYIYMYMYVDICSYRYIEQEHKPKLYAHRHSGVFNSSH